jgi:hypothetical protein
MHGSDPEGAELARQLPFHHFPNLSENLTQLA